MGDTKIQWTDKTWSPVRARVKADAAQVAVEKGYTSLVQISAKMAGHVGPHCERVSHGCDHCYSDTNNGRCLPANGTGLPFDRRARDLVDTFIDERILTQPLRWKKPCKIFVENQADLFGEWVPDELIDRVFAVMALSPQHTFQVLTKRPERMRAYFAPGTFRDVRVAAKAKILSSSVLPFKLPDEAVFDAGRVARGESWEITKWPLANVWLGVSVEDQKTADERIQLITQVPAAKRFVSYEPALAAVDFLYPESLWPKGPQTCCDGRECGCMGRPVEPWMIYGIDWIIVGGESGPRARPFNTEWARSTIRQCRESYTACFVKQLGGKCMDGSIGTGVPGFGGYSDGVIPVQRVLRDRKGGTMSEWPEDLRVREFPGAPR